jgi:hypothetical protein
MGFIKTALGPADQQLVETLQPVIIATLRKAAISVQKGGGRAESNQWFGDASAPWMNDLARKLQMLASMINTKPIHVSFSPLSGRCGSEFAAALRPAGGWQDFVGGQNSMTIAQNQNFTMKLNLKWNTAPLYRSLKQPADSKFQTLVHECTHLFLNTDDDACGVRSCEATAARNPATAKKTADCWGYFVEEFRTGG